MFNTARGAQIRRFTKYMTFPLPLPLIGRTGFAE